MTRRYALIGYPIDKSPSPAMHNAAFKKLGIDATYELLPTHQEDLSKIIHDCKQGYWQGLNVTIPHKIEAAQHVLCDDVAAQAKAVNTLYHHQGYLHGTITDVDGVREPLRVMAFPETHGSALILGSGGAARAACIALAQLGSVIHVYARNFSAAQEMLGCVSSKQRGIIITPETSTLLEKVLPELSAIIQATPVGRNGEFFLLPWENLPSTCIAFEMLYWPKVTPFLKEAQKHTSKTLEGWHMLLAQGARSFEIWTGCQAPVQEMQEAILNHLASL